MRGAVTKSWSRPSAPAGLYIREKRGNGDERGDVITAQTMSADGHRARQRTSVIYLLANVERYSASNMIWLGETVNYFVVHMLAHTDPLLISSECWIHSFAHLFIHSFVLSLFDSFVLNVSGLLEYIFTFYR